MRFVTGGDSVYFSTLLYNSKAIRKLHPDSEIWLGNFGLTKEQIEQINPDKVIKIEGLNKDMSLNLLLKIKLCKKIPTPFIFLDGDSVLLKKWDIDPSQAELILTRREYGPTEINSGVFCCSNINAINKWHIQAEKNLQEGGGFFSEQNALFKISSNFNTKFIPCEIYNWDRWDKLKSEKIPNNVVVAHLKRKRVDDSKFMKLLPALK